MAHSFRTEARALLLVAAASLAASTGSAQAPPEDHVNPQALVESIRRNRPRMAEPAARAFLYHIAPSRSQPVPAESMLDTLRRQSEDAYWNEVAQLFVQFQMFQRAVAQDSIRAGLMLQLFGAEFEARDIQRNWNRANEQQKRELRSRLESVMDRHFAVEDQLRLVEMRDIARRLQEAQADNERRRQRRAEMVRYQVEDIIRDAERNRPEEF